MKVHNREMSLMQNMAKAMLFQGSKQNHRITTWKRDVVGTLQKSSWNISIPRNNRTMFSAEMEIWLLLSHPNTIEHPSCEK